MRSLAILLVINCAAFAQTFSFKTTNLTFPVTPSTVLIADFNGDGVPDLATAGGYLTVFLGKGDGTFLPPFETGVFVSAMAIADLNGDGKLDIVASASASSPNSSRAYVVFGNGDGTFQPAIQLGTLFDGVVTADFNGDGKQDIAMRTFSSARVDIALGRGDGTFMPAIQVPVGGVGNVLATADFNGDGKPDLVVLNGLAHNITILIGNGDGTFQPGVSYPATSETANAIAVGDLNRDGKPDVIVGGTSQIVWFLNNGDGTFQEARSISLGNGENVEYLAVGDLNGDGKPDLAAAIISSPPHLTLFAGLGDGTFGTAESFSIRAYPASLAIADLNKDGNLDLVTSNPSTDSVDVLLDASGGATFVRHDSTTQGNWHGVYGGDGYTVVGDTASNPSYVTPSPAGQSLAVWAPSASDVRALQKGSNFADRIAAAWYAANSFTVDLPFTDNTTHQLAAYFLDWDTTARRQTVEILNGNGTVLNTQTLNGSFHDGVYLVWNVNGHVKIRVTVTAGANPLLSGLFFGIGNPANAALTIHKTHSGNFVAGQLNAVYPSRSLTAQAPPRLQER